MYFTSCIAKFILLLLGFKCKRIVKFLMLISNNSAVKMRHILIVVLALCCVQVVAQPTFPVNGTHNKNHTVYAFTNATIHIDHLTVLENSTMLIKDGRVIEVSGKKTTPKGAVVYDLKGKHIYPSFIDLYSNYGMPVVKKDRSNNPRPQTTSNKKGAFNWNQAIKPETRAADVFTANAKKAKELRDLGFGSVLTHQQDGITRGTSVFASLSNENENKTLLKPDAAAQYSFRKGSSKQNYPSSLMGSIALLRQTYFDAKWYNSQKPKEQEDLSLQAFNRIQSLPQIFDAGDKLSILRADKIGDEFGIQYIFKGNGSAYQRIEEIRATNSTLIVPLNFPKAYDVSDPYDAMNVSLGQMKHWELAPTNAGVLSKNLVEFALTTADLKSTKVFWGNLRKAIKHGLSEQDALKALTSTPAKIIGMSKEIGSLEKGKIANFIITSGNLFASDNTIYENWVQGKRHIVTDPNTIDIRGQYDINLDNHIYPLKVEGSLSKPSAKVVLNDTTKLKAKIVRQNKLINISFSINDAHYQGPVRLSGNIHFDSGSWDGRAQVHDGTWINWTAIRNKKHRKKPKKTASDSLALGSPYFPNMAYGWDSLPSMETILIKNATVWTCEAEGILKETDILIRDGKIAQMGKIVDMVDQNSIRVIDATGKHVSPGIIDEHSHIAISRGVNEGSQAVTSEVSISDVVNSDDVNIYRQLSGGVTAAQLLHGSANPIGGQSALIKLRWGRTPEEMKISNAPGFIKFALGENVKQSNWGEYNTFRFPQTRMGVEQVYYDAFIRAKEYGDEWKAYNGLSKKAKLTAIPPRRDLELDALLEILNKERFVSCHSYIQSEINMLMHVADSMGFTLNTFTHILEGYKVADKMKAHGAGGSTFSDWWAYKYEVNEAIPFNGALMHNQGVVVAYNSDDAEMARRLNQEAAKAVKYGGVSQEDALKFVTLNPAKLLHLDQQMGSVKVGKDADLVIWSDNPLSIYAKAENTFIDGICYFDMEQDKKLRESIRLERARLIKKLMAAKKGGADMQRPSAKKHKLYHCDTMEEEY
jgi:imidazolonepropionase-like amidohydrolase